MNTALKPWLANISLDSIDIWFPWTVTMTEYGSVLFVTHLKDQYDNPCKNKKTFNEPFYEIKAKTCVKWQFNGVSWRKLRYFHEFV